jgi:hypothetical protein
MEIKKAILPVVVGTMAGLMVSVIGEKVVMASDMPADAEQISNQQVAIQWFTSLPVSAFVIMAVFAAVGALVAGIAASKLSDTEKKMPLVATSVLLMLAATYKLYLLSFQPATYSLLRLAVVIPMVVVGGKIAARLPGKPEKEE